MVQLVTRGMLVRSVVTAALVGILLFVINQGRRVLEPWDVDLVARLGATTLVPFVVSLVAAVLTRRELARSAPVSLASADRHAGDGAAP